MAHSASVKNRKQIVKKALHHAQQKNISAGEPTHEDHTVVYDDAVRIDRAPDNPNDVYLRDMFVVVHIRQEFLNDHEDRKMLNGQMISVEQELQHHGIYYQSIDERAYDAIQILCGDAEER